MQETVDQAAIDEILASAEADTPESRIDKLEKELDVLKGSVKKLLLDLRETLNNLENPFQNLQNLAEGALSAVQQPQIQVVPAVIPEPEKSLEEEEEEEVGEEEEESLEDEHDVAGHKESFEEVVPEVEGDSLQPQVGVCREESEVEAEPRIEDRTEEKMQRVEMFTRYDIVTLFNLMEWVKGMLEKYSIDSLRTMLDVFEAAGYITEESKDFVTKLAELIALNDGFEDMLLELYRLHKLMNPQDTSMDSKLLSLILEKRL
ncbi:MULTISPECIES: hypothetical protein [unclassified Archaeoglobus]|jgi:archaellum component FlaD/FlaE|uniref:hypothetical protein n=1 Tax=unclassified Archaeoglobus TaxID=2643606 RepID=UPI0025C22F44|nr:MULTISPECIES: hypothetical protein [unclassified Archaeoglobus]